MTKKTKTDVPAPKDLKDEELDEISGGPKRIYNVGPNASGVNSPTPTLNNDLGDLNSLHGADKQVPKLPE